MYILIFLQSEKEMVFAALRQILNQPLFKRKPILN